MVTLASAWAANPPPTIDSACDFNSDSDASLLRACRTGDAGAWDRLVERYERLVFSVALRNGLEREDAADVTQEVFVALLNAMDKLDDDEALASWLMTVSRRTAWRVHKRNGTVRPASSAGEPAAPSDPVEEWTSLVALHDAVVRMGDPCRTLIQSLYLDADQPSYAEVAVRMGRSVGGIGPLRGRCLDRLRSLIGDDFR